MRDLANILRDLAKDFARYRKDFARSRKRLCEISQNSLRDIANQLPQTSFTNGPCNSHSSMINRAPENNHGGGFRAFPSVQRGPKRGHHANAKRQGGQEFNLTEVGLGRRPRGRPRTRWRDYISTLAWERLGIPPSELVNVAREREVWGPLLELLPPRPDPG